MEDPLFDSMSSALTFAYRHSCQQYGKNCMAMMMPSPRSSGKGLSGLDGSAQAGIIRAIVGRQQHAERHVIVARYGVDAERLASMLAIVPVVMSDKTGRHTTDILVQKWFCGKIPLITASEHCGVSRQALTLIWRDVKKTLQSILDRAEGALHEDLRKAGLIA